MKKYVKYIFFQLAAPFLVITLTLTCIMWLTQALRFIEMIVNKGLGLSTFLYMSALLVPSLLLIIMPIALFCAVIFIYNKIIVDSELVVLKSVGLSKMALVKPAFILAIISTIFSYLISLYILPISYKEFKDTQIFVRDNYVSVLLQEGVFVTPRAGFTVYIDERGEKGLLKGILVHDTSRPNKVETYMAEKGMLVKTKSGPKFRLINGNRQELKTGKSRPEILFFKEHNIDMNIYTKKQSSRSKEPEERFIGELFFPEKDISENYKHKLNAEGHHRVIWPLFNIVFVLLATAGLLSGQFNRRGQWKRILTVSVLGVGFAIVNISLKGAIASSPGLVPLIYMNLIVVILGSIYFLKSGKIEVSLRNLFKK